MRNHSYEHDFDLHENETACRIHFRMKGFAHRDTRELENGLFWSQRSVDDAAEFP